MGKRDEGKNNTDGINCERQKSRREDWCMMVEKTPSESENENIGVTQGEKQWRKKTSEECFCGSVKRICTRWELGPNETTALWKRKEKNKKIRVWVLFIDSSSAFSPGGTPRNRATFQTWRKVRNSYLWCIVDPKWRLEANTHRFKTISGFVYHKCPEVPADFSHFIYYKSITSVCLMCQRSVLWAFFQMHFMNCHKRLWIWFEMIFIG